MKVLFGLLVTLLVPIACAAEDWSVNQSYAAYKIGSNFNADTILIVNNENTSIDRVTLHPPERVMALNFWQIHEDGYCMVPYVSIDNCTVTVMLVRPIEKTGYLVMVYQRADSGLTPQVTTNVPPPSNALVVILLLVVIVMGTILTLERLANVIPLPNVEESRLEEFLKVRDVLKSSPTRNKVLEYIGDGHSTSARLAKGFRMNQVAIKKHLDKLENAGLVEREVKKGKKHKYYRLTSKAKKLIE